MEAALAGAALAPHTLVAALEALPADTRPAPEAAEFIDAVAQGILLEALAPLVQQARARPGLPAARVQAPDRGFGSGTGWSYWRVVSSEFRLI